MNNNNNNHDPLNPASVQPLAAPAPTPAPVPPVQPQNAAPNSATAVNPAPTAVQPPAPVASGPNANPNPAPASAPAVSATAQQDAAITITGTVSFDPSKINKSPEIVQALDQIKEKPFALPTMPWNKNDRKVFSPHREVTAGKDGSLNVQLSQQSFLTGKGDFFYEKTLIEMQLALVSLRQYRREIEKYYETGAKGAPPIAPMSPANPGTVVSTSPAPAAPAVSISSQNSAPSDLSVTVKEGAAKAIKITGSKNNNHFFALSSQQDPMVDAFRRLLEIITSLLLNRRNMLLMNRIQSVRTQMHRELAAIEKIDRQHGSTHVQNFVNTLDPLTQQYVQNKEWGDFSKLVQLRSQFYEKSKANAEGQFTAEINPRDMKVSELEKTLPSMRNMRKLTTAEKDTNENIKRDLSDLSEAIGKKASEIGNTVSEYSSAAGSRVKGLAVGAYQMFSTQKNQNTNQHQNQQKLRLH